jgi:hypothetical protein
LTKEKVKLLKEWSHHGTFFKLLYCSTTDGLKSDTFEKKVLPVKDPILCLIKSDKGKVFGGFMSFNKGSESSRDERACLFSLTNKMQLKVIDSEKAILVNN